MTKKDIHIDPAGLTKGGGSLQKLGSELETGGSKLEQAGQRMAQHASRDKSGIGKVLMEVFGRGTQVAGDVIKEGGRVVKKSGQHLHDSGQAHVENDHRSKSRFDKLHPDAGKTPHPKGSGSGPGRGGKGGAGSPPHKPPTPPGGGGSGGSGSGGTGRNLGPSWHEENAKHFTPKEQHELRNAMKKLSEEPNDRGVPGSGKLTQHERELLARAQQHVTIDKDTPMQKVIPKDDVQKYIDGKYTQVGGFVARQQDATHLNTPESIIQGNRLDYAKTPYDTGAPAVHVMEFPANDPSVYKTPLGAPVAADHGALPGDPSVRHASDRMHDAANTVGLDPNSYNRANHAWPYSGAGVTADPSGIPEREMSRRMDIPVGSQIVEYDPAGNRKVTHVFTNKGWVPAP